MDTDLTVTDLDQDMDFIFVRKESLITRTEANNTDSYQERTQQTILPTNSK